MQSSEQKLNYNQPSAKEEVDYKLIYVSIFPLVRSMILKNSGTIDDAKDVFQETILIYYQNNQKEDFKLTSAIGTYLYGIARNIWLKQLRQKGKIGHTSYNDQIANDEILYEDDEIKQKQRLLIKHIENSGEKCQKILQKFFDGIPGENISKELGYSSYEYYRLAKKRCIDNLKSKIIQDPLFKEL